MASFSSRNRSTAVVPAPRDAIWKVLSDPGALADLTPLVKAISADGDLWCWQLNGISALGVSVAPAFTERMAFVDGERIDFEPDPPFGEQRAGATGTYLLSDGPDGGTQLAIDITITAELPLPRAAKRAVEKVMATTMEKTGNRFARNLYERLGLDPKFVASPEPA
ncbi:SRPBCC family protein [Aquihabitans sp. G128]|uniref:SRPBCC family protein n=1 Tax=Aquihabitans sp. G128 TaxID=2849779 RepID=UPI001C226FA4|nr:SRPBCC family protein [Aquihabitans sp. G128]QXC61233.1 SRPBCC family protein [Aquihabitans sp. G128]